MAYGGEHFYFSWRERPHLGYSILSSLRSQDLVSTSSCPHHSTSAVLEMHHWMKLIREGRGEERKAIDVLKLYNEHKRHRAGNGVERDECGTKELLSWLTTYVAKAEDGSEVCRLESFECLMPLKKMSDFSKMLEHLIKEGPFVGAFFIKEDFRAIGQELYMCNGKISRYNCGKPRRHAVAVVGFGIDRNYNMFWEYQESCTPFVTTYKKDGFNRIFVTGFDRAYLLHV